MFIRGILNKISSFLFPIYFITGPALTDFLLTLTGLFNLDKIKYVYFKNKYFVYYFILFFLLLVLSGFLSNYNINHSLSKSFLNLRFIIFVFFLIYFFRNQSFDLLAKIVTITLSIVSLDLIIQFFFLKNIFFMEPINTNRYSGFFGKELVAGSFISKFAAISLFYLFFNKKSFFISLCIYLLIAFAIILSGEKLALLNFLFVSIILFVILSIHKKTFKFLIILILLFPIMYILLLSNLKPIERQINGFYNQLGIKITSDKNIDYSAFLKNSQYAAHYLVSYEIFKDNFIFGIGPDNFEQACNDYKYEEILKKKYKHNLYKPNQRCSSHPHNLHFQILQETGVITYLLILIGNLFLIYKSIKYFLNNNNLPFLGFFLSYIVLILPFASTNYFNNWNACLLHYILGIYLAFYFRFIHIEKKNEK